MTEQLGSFWDIFTTCTHILNLIDTSNRSVVWFRISVAGSPRFHTQLKIRTPTRSWQVSNLMKVPQSGCESVIRGDKYFTRNNGPTVINLPSQTDVNELWQSSGGKMKMIIILALCSHQSILIGHRNKVTSSVKSMYHHKHFLWFLYLCLASVTHPAFIFLSQRESSQCAVEHCPTV